MSDNNTIKCPVCGADAPVSGTCPECGFEVIAVAGEPTEEMRQWLDSRVAQAKERYEKQKEQMGRKPRGFLVTDRMAVCCLYEGRNVFGSAKASESEPTRQKVILPGIMLRPSQFVIDTVVDGRRSKFFIKELEEEGIASMVFVNQTTNPATAPIELADGDNILVISGDNRATITFRTNTNL